ncbi:3-dehydroquinate synthase [Sandarakinorhabdus sp.]|uniref:3-dehydroquinate synthase n=1 Tax=Sandarakinorhabdus sp. TaxID=1916663 RepID=UPI003F6EE85B
MIVQVALGARAYPIHIQAGLLGNAAPVLGPFVRGNRLVVVTDSQVAALYLDRLSAGLSGVLIEPIILPPGEATKDWVHLQLVVERLLTLGVERSDAVVALGGGVIGDLTGFACSILRRGCRFVQVPTTLLAQVDSSVGGKTAINAAAGKNLVGAFHQPAAVLIDPQVLATLPARELRAGYAEVVKYGLINDADFFAWCEANGAAVLAGDTAAQTYAIAHGCKAKAAVVAADERETDDIRALLNLGHTFGHAFEAAAGFSDRLLHGEAVALGMALAHRFSAHRGLCSAEDAARVDAHLAASGFEIHPAVLGLATNAADLIHHMRQDKKMSGGTLPFILSRRLGESFVARDVPLGAVEAFLADELADVKRP